MVSQADIMDFVAAVEQDTYAELQLSSGDWLITDWEGDGVFSPYVVPELDAPRTREYAENVVADAIADALSIQVRAIEYDSKNSMFVPYMDRPTQSKVCDDA